MIVKIFYDVESYVEFLVDSTSQFSAQKSVFNDVRTTMSTNSHGFILPVDNIVLKLFDNGGNVSRHYDSSIGHYGIDIASGGTHYKGYQAIKGATIRAVKAGKIVVSGRHKNFGYYVKIGHGGGIQTLYAHMLSTPLVSTGASVAQGAAIGYVGSTGPHLHFEVHINGTRVNPFPYLQGTSTHTDVETQVVAMANNPNWNEGDKAKIGVVFRNDSSSSGTFPITIWVGDGINKGKAEAYKIETSIRIGAGQTYIYHIPDTVTMQPWITTVTARKNWSNRGKETNPNNNERTFALTVEVH